MELDDLKERWKASQQFPSADEVRKDLEQKLSEIRSSGHGIRRAFVIEIAVIVFLYSIFFGVVYIMGDLIMPFIYKMVTLVTLGSIPAVWRLFKSQQWINSMDYSKDMRSNMVAFLKYYKKTLTIYRVTTYVVIIASTFLMFFDRSFTQLSMLIKLLVVVYMFGVMLATGPYIQLMYGNRTKSIESFLRE